MPIRSKKSNKSKRSSSNGPPLVTEFSHAAHEHDRDPLHRRSQSQSRDASRMTMPDDITRPHTKATTIVGQNKRSGGTRRRKGGGCSDDSYISFDDRTRSTATISSRSSSSESSGGHSCIGRQSAGQRRSRRDRSFGRNTASLHQSISGEIDLWQPGSRSHASTAHLLLNSSFNIADDYEDWDMSMSERHFKKEDNAARAMRLSQEAAEFFHRAERDSAISKGRMYAKSPLEIVGPDASSSCSTVSSLTLPNTKRRGGSVAGTSTGQSCLSRLSHHSDVFRWNQR